MGFGKKFRRTTFIAAIRFILVRLSSLIYLMIMARWLSKNEMGIIATLGIGVVLIPKGVLDWLGWVMQQKSLTSTEDTFAKNVIGEIAFNMLIIGLTFCPALAIFYLYIMNIHFASTVGILFLFIVVLDIFVQLFRSVEAAQFNLEFRILTIFLHAVLNYILAILLYFFFKSIEVILVAWAVTEVLICLILLPRNWKIFHRRIKAIGFRSIFKFGTPVFFLYLFSSLSSTIDRIIIGIFLEYETLATYHLVFRIADVFAKGVLTFTIAIFPIIMKLEGLNTKSSNLVFTGMLKVVMLIILTIFPFLIMFSSYVITLILSDKYLAGTSLLSILAIGMIFDIISNINIQFKGSKGETKFMLNYVIFYFLSQTLAYLILFRLGAIGIAYSRIVGSAISFAYVMNSSAWLKEIPRIFLGKILFLIISMVITLWILGQFLHVIIALVISIVIVFLESGVIQYFTKEELSTIEKGLPSEAQPLFAFYKQIETIMSIGELKTD